MEGNKKLWRSKEAERIVNFDFSAIPLIFGGCPKIP